MLQEFNRLMARGFSFVPVLMIITFGMLAALLCVGCRETTIGERWRCDFVVVSNNVAKIYWIGEDDTHQTALLRSDLDLQEFSLVRDREPGGYYYAFSTSSHDVYGGFFD